MATAERADAIQRLLELLTPAARELAEKPDVVVDGYIDLLGPEELESTGFTQDLMTTSVVPRIYERWWRPAMTRAFKGLTGPSMSEELRIARLLTGLSPGDNVLDLACGPGNFTRAFAQTVGDDGLAVGVDASRTMLARGAAEIADAGLENVVLIRADGTDLPCRDGAFDAVCCFAALHLFAEPMSALDQMRRVLRPGGRIAIMTSIRRGLTPSPLKPVLERGTGMRMFESDEIVGALRDRGFTGIHQRLAGLVQFVGGRLG